MYHHQALPFSMHSIHPADLTDTSSQAMLAEVSSIPMYWDQIEFPYGASDTDLPFLACLTAPSLNLDTCNLLDDKNFDEQPPHFTDLLATVTTYQRNLDQQVLQEKTNPLIAVCGENNTTPIMRGCLEIANINLYPHIDKASETRVTEAGPQADLREGKHKGSKGNRTSQTLHLWEFVRDLLLTPQRNQETVRWENRKEGTFRVIKSDMFAQLWGEQKNNKCMNYEKLSRALRHYYKTGILERVDGRLTYKFGRKAHGWREDSPQQST